MTMASSMMSPTDAAMAPKDMTLIVIPAKWHSRMLKATVTGMVSMTTMLDLHERRNNTMTARARKSPS